MPSLYENGELYPSRRHSSSKKALATATAAYGNSSDEDENVFYDSVAENDEDIDSMPGMMPGMTPGLTPASNLSPSTSPSPHSGHHHLHLQKEPMKHLVKSNSRTSLQTNSAGSSSPHIRYVTDMDLNAEIDNVLSASSPHGANVSRGVTYQNLPVIENLGSTRTSTPPAQVTTTTNVSRGISSGSAHSLSYGSLNFTPPDNRRTSITRIITLNKDSASGSGVSDPLSPTHSSILSVDSSNAVAINNRLNQRLSERESLCAHVSSKLTKLAMGLGIEGVTGNSILDLDDITSRLLAGVPEILNAYRRETKVYKTQMEELTGTIDSLQGNNESITKRNKELMKANKLLEEKCEDLNMKIDRHIGTIHSSNLSIMKMENDQSDMKAKHAGVEARVAILTSQHELLEKENNALRVQCENLNDTNIQFDEELTILRTQKIPSLLDIVKSQTADLQLLHSKLASIEDYILQNGFNGYHTSAEYTTIFTTLLDMAHLDSNQDYVSDRSLGSGSSSKFVTHITSITSQLDDSKRRLGELEIMNRDLRIQLSQSADPLHLEEISKKLEESQTRITLLEADNYNLRAKLDKALSSSTDLEGMQRDLDGSRAAHLETKRVLDEHKLTVSDLESEIQTLTETINEQQSTIESLETELSKKQQEISTLIIVHNDHKSEHETTVNELTEEIQQLQAQLRDHQADIASKHAHIEELTETHSRELLSLDDSNSKQAVIDELNHSIEKLKIEIETISAHHAELQAEHDSHLANHTELVRELQDNLNGSNREVDHLRSVHDATHSDYEEQMRTIREEHTIQVTTIEKSLEEKLRELEHLSNSHSANLSELEILRLSILELEDQIKKADEDYAVRETELTHEFEQRIETLEAELAAANAKLETVLKEKSALETDFQARELTLNQKLESFKQEVTTTVQRRVIKRKGKHGHHSETESTEYEESSVILPESVTSRSIVVGDSITSPITEDGEDVTRDLIANPTAPLEERLAELEAQLEAAINESDANSAKFEKKRAGFQYKVIELESALSERDSAISDLETKLGYHKEFKGLHANCVPEKVYIDLKNSHEQLKDQHALCQLPGMTSEEREEYEDVIAELREELQYTMEQLHSIHGNYEALDTEHRDLLDTHGLSKLTLEQEIKDLTSERNSFINRLELNDAALEKRNMQLESQKEEYETTIETLRAEIDHARGLHSEVQTNYASLLDKHNLLSEELNTRDLEVQTRSLAPEDENEESINAIKSMGLDHTMTKHELIMEIIRQHEISMVTIQNEHGSKLKELNEEISRRDASLDQLQAESVQRIEELKVAQATQIAEAEKDGIITPEEMEEIKQSYELQIQEITSKQKEAMDQIDILQEDMAKLNRENQEYIDELKQEYDMRIKQLEDTVDEHQSTRTYHELRAQELETQMQKNVDTGAHKKKYTAVMKEGSRDIEFAKVVESDNSEEIIEKLSKERDDLLEEKTQLTEHLQLVTSTLPPMINVNQLSNVSEHKQLTEIVSYLGTYVTETKKNLGSNQELIAKLRQELEETKLANKERSLNSPDDEESKKRTAESEKEVQELESRIAKLMEDVSQLEYELIKTKSLCKYYEEQNQALRQISVKSNKPQDESSTRDLAEGATAVAATDNSKKESVHTETTVVSVIYGPDGKPVDIESVVKENATLQASNKKIQHKVTKLIKVIESLRLHMRGLIIYMSSRGIEPPKEAVDVLEKVDHKFTGGKTEDINKQIKDLTSSAAPPAPAVVAQSANKSATTTTTTTTTTERRVKSHHHQNQNQQQQSGLALQLPPITTSVTQVQQRDITPVSSAPITGNSLLSVEIPDSSLMDINETTLSNAGSPIPPKPSSVNHFEDSDRSMVASTTNADIISASSVGGFSPKRNVAPINFVIPNSPQNITIKSKPPQVGQQHLNQLHLQQQQNRLMDLQQQQMKQQQMYQNGLAQQQQQMYVNQQQQQQQQRRMVSDMSNTNFGMSNPQHSQHINNQFVPVHVTNGTNPSGLNHQSENSWSGQTFHIKSKPQIPPSASQLGLPDGTEDDDFNRKGSKKSKFWF